MSGSRALRRVANGLDHLRRLTLARLDGDAVDFEQLITEYLVLRRALARDFREIAEEEMGTGELRLYTVRRQVTHRMKELYGGRVSDHYLEVRGYTGVHLFLFEYLSRHVGQPVGGSRLRVLTGDQVHTERRLRELRDLGFDLTSTRADDDDQYVLHSAVANLEAAARSQTERNIREDRKLSDGQKSELLVLVETSSQVLPGIEPP